MYACKESFNIELSMIDDDWEGPEHISPAIFVSVLIYCHVAMELSRHAASVSN